MALFRKKSVVWACGGLLPLLWIVYPTRVAAESTGSHDAHAAAAESVARDQPLCRGIAPFYWEIGDGRSVLASGSTGDGSIARDTTLPIASASKWVFGAYVVQRLQGNLDAQTQKALKMTSGYTNLAATSCIVTPTVQDCQTKGSNAQYSAEYDNKFFYNGGHFQKWAVDHGLGPMTRPELVQEYQKQLGSDFDFNFGAFQMAGGIRTSAGNYAVFLRKILNGQLLMKKFLGANPTCTQPSSCPQAARSPVRAAWHYSYGHWVEDGAGDDGAFSSPGAFGFYPWIDATKTYYGIISRRHRARGGDGEAAGEAEGAGAASAQCGLLIRRAYFGK